MAGFGWRGAARGVGRATAGVRWPVRGEGRSGKAGVPRRGRSAGECSGFGRTLIRLRPRRRAAVLCAAAFALPTALFPPTATAAPGPPSDCLRTIAQPDLSKAKSATLPWAQQRLGLTADGAWSVTQGAGVLVAVVDTGVDATNPALAGAVQRGESAVSPGDTGDYDCDGHGTAVAGIIAGRTDLVYKFTGVAPQATIVPIRQVYHSGRSGETGPLDLARAIEMAVDTGARVINVSITTGDDPPELEQAVKDAEARDILIVASAGNENDNGPKYPASIDGVLSVGSVDANGAGSRFSERAAGAAISAPGQNVMVLCSKDPYYLRTENGTSFAAPYVAGTAALVRAAFPTLTYRQVIDRLEATADRPKSGHSFDPTLGWGIVNPYRAVTAVLPLQSAAAATPVAPAKIPLPAASPRDSDSTAVRVGLAVLAAALAAVAVPLAAAAARKGRARGWRAGGAGPGA